MKMNIKKALSLLLAAALILSVLPLVSSCSAEDENTLTVSVDRDKCPEFYDAMVKKFPNISFKVTPLKNRADSDIIYYPNITKLKSEMDILLDLSGYPFMGNIRDDILQFLDVDGRIYQIPSPLEINCIIYNKTLFKENGWPIPESFDELISAVELIRSSAPDITPIAINLDNQGNAFNLVATLSQCGFLSMPEGDKWEQDFFADEASIETGFSEGLSMLERLIDSKAFDIDKYVAGEAGEKQLTSRRAAMEFYFDDTDSFFEAVSRPGVTEDEFGLLPFFGADVREKLVGVHADSAWSINKKLAGNKAKLENALAVMEWITTQEAQYLLGNNAARIPVIKDIGDDASDELFAELWSIASDGYKANSLYTGYEHIITDTSRIIIRAMINNSSKNMRDEFIKTADKLNNDYVREQIKANRK